jgi:hypothetical protein
MTGAVDGTLLCSKLNRDSGELVRRMRDGGTKYMNVVAGNQISRSSGTREGNF